MRHLNGIYTKRNNRLNGTDGPLFRGRYKSILVESDAYLVHLSKYIHLNPYEARMVKSLSDYKWSSYQAFIGLSDTPNWLFKEALQIKHYGGVANAIALIKEKIENIPEILIQINSIIKRLDP